MKKLTLALLAVWCVAFALPAHGVSVRTTSYVLAPICCEVANIQIVNTVNIDSPEPMWANQPFSHMWFAAAYWCDGTFNNFKETCCIGSGNQQVVKTYFNNLACPLAAKGRSYGWIGGNPLPYYEHQSESLCTNPCYCNDPPEGPCDPWDPWCFD